MQFPLSCIFSCPYESCFHKKQRLLIRLITAWSCFTCIWRTPFWWVSLPSISHVGYFCFPFTGDVNSISVGSGTNIQDNSLVHVAKSNLSGKVLPTIIGDNVTVGKWHAMFSMEMIRPSCHGWLFTSFSFSCLSKDIKWPVSLILFLMLMQRETWSYSNYVWNINPHTPSVYLRKAFCMKDGGK